MPGLWDSYYFQQNLWNNKRFNLGYISEKNLSFTAVQVGCPLKRTVGFKRI